MRTSRNQTVVTVLAVAVLFVTVIAAAQSTAATDRSAAFVGKKVIAFGGAGGPGGVPSVEHFVTHLNEMEKNWPVDGILISINPTIGGKHLYYADEWFGGKRFDMEDFRPLIAKLKTIKPKRYANNFIRLNVIPGDVDWFDDSGWQTIVNNFTIAVRVAKATGMKGIFLDTEQYWSSQGIAPLSYNNQKQRDKHSFDAYCRQAHKRGEDLGAVVGKIYPGMHLLMTYSLSYVCHEIGWARQLPLQSSSMSLLPSLVDGLMSVSPDIVVHDAYERAYGLKTYTALADARDKIKQKAAIVSPNPERYRKHIRAGFGLWIRGTEKGLNTTDFVKNSFTPRELEHALSYALELCDGYVWLYMGGMPVFGGSFSMPDAYIKAVHAAKRPHNRSFRGPQRPKGPGIARQSQPPNSYVFEVEDLSPRIVEGTGPLQVKNSAIGLQNWGQSGKMVTVVHGIDATGTVRFTFPAIEDGAYALRVRIHYPHNKHSTTIQWRDGATRGEVKAISGPGEGWTAVRFGDEAKGTRLGYGGWMWLELYGPDQIFKQNNVGPKQFKNVKDGCYWVELRDDNKLTYNLVEVDQFELSIPEGVFRGSIPGTQLEYSGGVFRGSGSIPGYSGGYSGDIPGTQYYFSLVRGRPGS